MRLNSRLKRLTDAMPTCKPGIQRLVGPNDPAVEQRCPKCGGSHVLLVEEIVVRSPEELEAVRGRIAKR